jgi:hypothetical protein
MRTIGFAALLILLAGAGQPAYADTVYAGQVSDHYGYRDPYYNGSPYIPVPASVLYGCHSSDCTVYEGQQPQQQYAYPAPYVQRGYPAYDNGAEKGITYVQPANNYTTNNVYPTYTTAYPGTPNTGAHGQGTFNLSILIASALTAAGAGLYLLRTRRHA